MKDIENAPVQNDLDKEELYLNHLLEESGLDIQDIEVTKETKGEYKNNNNKKKQKPISIADLLSMEIPPIDVIVEGLIPVGLTVLAAPPKSGKSFFVLQMALDIVSGKRFMGQRKTQQCKVLYYSLEDSDRRVQNRAKSVLTSNMKTCNYNNEDFRGLEIQINAPTLKDGFLEELKELVKENGYKVIIIDVLQMILGNSNARNEYNDIYDRLGKLKKWALDSNLSVIAITHTNKGQFDEENPFNSFMGSNAFVGVPDETMVLHKLRNGDAKLYTQGKDLKNEVISLHFDEDLLEWQWVGNAEEMEDRRKREEFKVNKYKKYIIENLIKHNGNFLTTKKDMKAEMKETKDTSHAISKWINENKENFEEIGVVVKDMGNMTVNGATGKYTMFSTVSTEALERLKKD